MDLYIVQAHELIKSSILQDNVPIFAKFSGGGPPNPPLNTTRSG